MIAHTSQSHPLALLRPVRAPLIAAATAQALAAALALLPLLALIAFIGAWLSGDALPGADVIVAAVIGTIGAAGLSSFAAWVTHRADAHLARRLQRRLAAVIRRAPLPTVTGLGAARIRKVVQDDTAAMHYLVAHTLLDATSLVVTPVAGFVALAVIDWRLALVSAVPLALGAWWYLMAMRGAGSKFAEYAAAQQRISRVVVDEVRGLPVAKIYGALGGAPRRYGDAVDGFHTFFRAWSGSTAAVTTASWLVVAPAVTTGLLTLMGGAGLLAGWISSTALVAGVMLGPVISAPIAVAGPRVQALRAGYAALGQVSRLIASPRLEWGDEAPPARRSVPSLFDATVRYDDAAALDGVSLSLPRRGFVAIVGASGSGKSTLAGLLARFADPDEGKVMLGDVDYRMLAEADLYDRVGFVFQDTTLRDATVRDLLSGGRAVHHDRLVGATRLAAIDDVVDSLPEGYDTVIGRDTELSGGQRQRIALARAFVREPDSLVLDEALASLDPVTRARILESLHDQARERLVVLIAHHLHLTRDADRIVVLDGGRLVGDGTHEQLLERCPAYLRLWRAQALQDPAAQRARPRAASPGAARHTDQEGHR